MSYGIDGTSIVTRTDRMLRVWDPATSQPIGSEPPLGILPVSYSPDSRTFVAWSSEKAVRLWDTVTGQPVGPPLELGGRVSLGSPQSLVFSADGRSMVTTSFSKLQKCSVKHSTTLASSSVSY